MVAIKKQTTKSTGPKKATKKVVKAVAPKLKIKKTLKFRFPGVKPTPRTAYQLFSSNLCKERGLKIGDPSISEEWKLIKDDSTQYQIWADKAVEDKDRYMNLIKEHYPEAEVDKKPKKSCPPFILFSKEECPKIVAERGCSYKDALSTVGERWKALSEEQRQPYIDEAERLKKEFEANNQ